MAEIDLREHKDGYNTVNFSYTESREDDPVYLLAKYLTRRQMDFIEAFKTLIRCRQLKYLKLSLLYQY